MKQRGACRRALLVGLDPSGEPPKEVRLFVWGENATMNGVYVLDKEGAAEALRAFEAYGNSLAWDYEHDTFNDKATGARPASGWTHQGGLSIRDDGLWAAVEWTARAVELIRAKEYRYFSPSFNYETDSRRIVELLPSGLVNYPATIGMKPLTAKRKGNATMKLNFASLAAAQEAAQAAVAAKFGEGATVVDVTEKEIVFSMNGKTWQTAYTVDDAGAVTLTGELVEVQTESPDNANGEDPTPATSGGAAAPAKLGAAAAVEKLTREVAKLRTQAEERERATLIADGVAAKKLTPALKKWAATQPVATLKSFLASAPAVAQLAATPTREPGDKPGATKLEEMTAVEFAALKKENPDYAREVLADGRKRGVSFKRAKG
jgi:phage I-like protein